MPRAPTILTDIEGTTSSIHFVHQVLFPYAREHLPAFVRDHANAPEVQQQLEAVARETAIPAQDQERLIQALLQWIDEDRKATPLKALQGMVWERGYREGRYHAHVYPDARAALERWHATGIPIYVYSSGSVAAQKLYFRHTEAGDLTCLFRGYFDTTIGGKRDAHSYTAIAQAIGTPATSILFLSDVAAELDAAQGAGMQTRWVQRDATPTPSPAPTGHHPVVRSFDEIGV